MVAARGGGRQGRQQGRQGHGAGGEGAASLLRAGGADAGGGLARPRGPAALQQGRHARGRRRQRRRRRRGWRGWRRRGWRERRRRVGGLRSTGRCQLGGAGGRCGRVAARAAASRADDGVASGADAQSQRRRRRRWRRWRRRWRRRCRQRCRWWRRPWSWCRPDQGAGGAAGDPFHRARGAASDRLHELPPAGVPGARARAGRSAGGAAALPPRRPQPEHQGVGCPRRAQPVRQHRHGTEEGGASCALEPQMPHGGRAALAPQAAPLIRV